jgi:peptide/nickel transport system substrate-binding protein
MLAAAMLLSLLLAADGRHGGRLIVAQRAEPKTLNPVIAVDAPSREVIRRTTADLISIDRQTLRTVPNLAESWTVSKDGRQFTLHLRRGVKFSDGHPFDASDVLFTFQVYLDENVNSSQRDLLIVGGKPLKVSKLDDYTVRFDLAQPYAAAERIFDSLAMLPRHRLEPLYRSGALAKSWNLNTPPPQMAGLGPFRLKLYVPGEKILLERNPFYWKADPAGRPLPYLDEMEFQFTGSEDAQVTRFLTGDTGITGRLGARNFQLLQTGQGSRGLQLVDAGPSTEYSFLTFNLSPTAEKTWFQQTAFRQAVSVAIDRDAIVKLVYLGRATALKTHVTPANKPWIDASLPDEPRTLEKARALLQSAGFRWDASRNLLDSAGHPVEFSLATSAGNQERVQIATMIQDDLKQLGMRVTVAPLEFRTLNDRVLNTHRFDTALLALGGGDVDPNSEMNLWLSSGGLHLWNPNQKQPATPWEAEIDDLMRRQLVTLDPVRRKQLYARLQRIELEQRPIVALVSPNLLVAAKGGLGNFRPSILEHYTLWNVEQLYWKAPKAKSE